MAERRVGRYRDVEPNAPTGAILAAAAFVEREWGTAYQYRMGLIGYRIIDRWLHVFQVIAPDGSRFAVWADRCGNTGQCEGLDWLSWLGEKGIEASVPLRAAHRDNRGADR